MSKTYIAVRPGFKQQAEAAFGTDMEIEVDSSLQADYEFRQRELGLADLLEAELESEEGEAARKADPKNAHTFIVPLAEDPEEVEDYTYLDYLVVRVDKDAPKHEALQVIQKTQLIWKGEVGDLDERIQARPNINALNAELRKAGIKVHSISLAKNLVWMTP